ncbi:PREDICTED: uncharacterized protein LOC106815670 [Priapulus caudatus]|uniref:Uncharacterized protein LOC106815670 n=1 Tax=Priapulus caudatus TaxID=37621 RepID=A0ABM1ETY2_PRICU|nr:PREDICTED: uncharacterized protein LOC106815670 [Priapulus caudatus]
MAFCVYAFAAAIVLLVTVEAQVNTKFPDCKALAEATVRSGERCPTSRLWTRCTEEEAVLECTPSCPNVFTECHDGGKAGFYLVTVRNRANCKCILNDGNEILVPGFRIPYGGRPPKMCNPVNCNCPPDATIVQEVPSPCPSMNKTV